jgi:hypothetical protein
VTTEHFYIVKMSIEVEGDEYAGSKLEVPCPFFGIWGFSACRDMHYPLQGNKLCEDTKTEYLGLSTRDNEMPQHRDEGYSQR